MRYVNEIKREILYFARRVYRPAFCELDGVRLRMDIPELEKLRYAIYRGGYETAERQVVKQTLEPSDRVIEIGSGIGLMATLCSKILGDDSRVVTFEANPTMADRIRETFELNDVRPIAYNAFVGAERGKRKFFRAERFESSSGTHRSEGATEVEVEQLSFKDILDQHQSNYLVIDIEGAETEIAPLIPGSRITKICMEVHPHYVGDKAVSGIVALLIDAGFEFCLDISRGRVLYFRRELA